MPFITFEGVEGMGKSTQLLGLEAALRQGGFSVLRTFEPGDTPLGRELRGHLLGHQFNPDKRTELLLYAADRAEHVAKVIRPMLQIQGAAGPAFVLCDRYADASLAYQGGGRALPMDWLRQLNHYATDGLQPDLTFSLTVIRWWASSAPGAAPCSIASKMKMFHFLLPCGANTWNLRAKSRIDS